MIAILDEHIAVLRDEYGLDVTDISPVTGGWSALAYKVDSRQGTYFLKVYDKKRSGIASLLANLSLCMAAVAWLDANTGLRGKICAPVPAKGGEIKAETGGYAYLLFPYINGVTVQTTPLTLCQQKELAAMVAQLHLCGGQMPLDLSPLREDYDIPCGQLMKIPCAPGDSLCVHRQRDMLMRAVEQAYSLAEYVKAAKPPLVLCHADIHGWNLMQGEKLHLIDWESLRFAPAEADLYTFWNDWYWGDTKWGSYWGSFLPVYQALRPEYVVDEKILRFYQMRRHIEDIDAFYRQYLYDDMEKAQADEVISCLRRECAFLAAMTKDN